MKNRHPYLDQENELTKEDCDQLSTEMRELSNSNRILIQAMDGLNQDFEDAVIISGVGHLADLGTAVIGAVAISRTVFQSSLNIVFKNGSKLTSNGYSWAARTGEKVFIGALGAKGVISGVNNQTEEVAELTDVPGVRTMILSFGSFGDWRANQMIEKADTRSEALTNLTSQNRQLYSDAKADFDAGNCSKYYE